MGWIILKYLTTAGLVVLISEVAKRSDKLGALIAALPMVTVLTLIWLAVERHRRKNCQPRSPTAHREAETAKAHRG